MSALLILYAVFLTGVNDLPLNKEFIGHFMIFSRLLFSLHLMKHNIRILRTSLLYSYVILLYQSRPSRLYSNRPLYRPHKWHYNDHIYTQFTDQGLINWARRKTQYFRIKIIASKVNQRIKCYLKEMC